MAALHDDFGIVISPDLHIVAGRNKTDLNKSIFYQVPGKGDTQNNSIGLNNFDFPKKRWKLVVFL